MLRADHLLRLAFALVVLSLSTALRFDIADSLDSQPLLRLDHLCNSSLGVPTDTPLGVLLLSDCGGSAVPLLLNLLLSLHRLGVDASVATVLCYDLQACDMLTRMGFDTITAGHLAEIGRRVKEDAGHGAFMYQPSREFVRLNLLASATPFMWFDADMCFRHLPALCHFLPTLRPSGSDSDSDPASPERLQQEHADGVFPARAETTKQEHEPLEHVRPADIVFGHSPFSAVPDGFWYHNFVLPSLARTHPHPHHQPDPDLVLGSASGDAEAGGSATSVRGDANVERAIDAEDLRPITINTGVVAARPSPVLLDFFTHVYTEFLINLPSMDHQQMANIELFRAGLRLTHSHILSSSTFASSGKKPGGSVSSGTLDTGILHGQFVYPTTTTTNTNTKSHGELHGDRTIRVRSIGPPIQCDCCEPRPPIGESCGVDHPTCHPGIPQPMKIERLKVRGCWFVPLDWKEVVLSSDTWNSRELLDLLLHRD
mmetsp:Transcript_15998/g.27539  ORF Transcript_15998/g.27539 Transcript_15998/m.27539 type:complete len:485 (-) Transcript_15998:20-1474(-)